jgi:hypothetical protein|tara:strand:+ start:592 stop:1368 length:777 start_codon:yes stop_codon:yes gene_type:complete
MAIKSNNSDVTVMGGGITYYSGISNFKVVAVNPDLKELHEIGVNYKSEPNYDVNFGGEDFTKLVFWLKNEDLTTSMEILMSAEEKLSKAGKPLWINNIGQSSYSDTTPVDNPNMSWWKEEGTHKCVKGEDTLIAFTQAWANVANGEEVRYETISKIAKGDVAEIKALVKLLDSNEARVLVGVRQADTGKTYQSVYTKFFGRITPVRDDLFAKKLNDGFNSFKAEFPGNLQWGPHTPEINTVQPDPAPLLSLDESTDWS